jgi:hypothetical protein
MAEPWFAATLDGVTPIGGVNVSLGSSAVTTDRGNLFGSLGLGAESPLLPVRDSGSAGFALVKGNGGTDRVVVTLKAVDGTDRIRVVGVSNSDNELQYWDGSAWQTIGASFETTNSLTQYRIDWTGYGTSAGAITMRAFLDAGEAAVASRAGSGLDLTALSGIARLHAVVTNRGGGTQPSITAMFVADDDGDTSYVYQNVANANGADTGGTGTFSSVNSTGTTYDSSFISLPTAGNRRSVKNTAARNYGGRTIRAVAINARLRRGVTGPSRATLYLTIGGTRYYHPNVQLLTTGFVPYTFVFETNPATGIAWEITEAEAAALEWGVEAVA